MELSQYSKTGRGRLAALARAIAAPQPNVSDWASGKRPVPIERCLAIERATGGLVTRGELRPHDGHLIWPDVVQGPVPHSEETPTALHPPSGADREESSHG